MQRDEVFEYVLGTLAFFAEIEQLDYASAWHLFEKANISQYLTKQYAVLHTQGDWFVLGIVYALLDNCRTAHTIISEIYGELDKTQVTLMTKYVISKISKATGERPETLLSAWYKSKTFADALNSKTGVARLGDDAIICLYLREIGKMDAFDKLN